jgi:rifampicin phosphotransferase
MVSPRNLPFDPPGPGSWGLDPVHFPRPVTQYWVRTHPGPFARGFAGMATFYGLLFETRQTAYVNGFSYGQIIPVAPEEVPVRLARADEVVAGRLWREQVREWDEVAKPAAIAKHLELQAIEPDTLSDAELSTYLTRCRDHHAAMIEQHMRFTGTATIPPADLLAHVGDWTGLPASELLGMMRGASPVSGGDSSQMTMLIDAIGKDPGAKERLESGDEPGKVLDQLRRENSDAGRALEGYLQFAGYRLLDGFDISNRYALEMPDVLLRAINSAIAGKATPAADVDAQVTGVRDKVPAEHREMFDELLAEARMAYRIRDERGVFSDIWASGLMRRAAMTAGRRVAARGGVHDAEHFVYADLPEMQDLLAGTGGPTADVLADRYEYANTYTAKDAPGFIGDPPQPPPDPSGLPPSAARLMRALGIAMGAMFGASEQEHEHDLLNGLAASAGVYEGPVRRVTSPADFDSIRQGDVLVTESTTEAFNILLPLLGAIVTDNGGLLSHAAIVAREYGIPGVVGTRDATDRIAEGSRVRVDGDKGEVTVLE